MIGGCPVGENTRLGSKWRKVCSAVETGARPQERVVPSRPVRSEDPWLSTLQVNTNILTSLVVVERMVWCHTREHKHYLN